MLPENVLNNFVSIWGDDFDYSKAEFVSRRNEMLVRCKKHDLWFHISPEMHEKSRGCPACAEEIKKNQEKRVNDSFIRKCKSIYGDKYSYEKTSYTYDAKNVIITCPVHGDVEISVKSLLAGHGCTKCNKVKRKEIASKPIKSQQDWLDDFIKVHGDTYEYDFSTFVNGKTKMKILCHKHGEFWQSPEKHRTGRGCPKCGRDRIKESHKMSREEFVEKANHVHNFKYDYSLLDFRGTQEKAIFICHEKDENGIEHGPFEQQCASHLSGCGCPKCAQNARNEFFTVPFDEFVRRAKDVHGDDDFSYDASTYKNLNTSTRIICPEHGEFWQKPVHHLRGHGCPKCAKNGILRTYEEFEEIASQVHNGKYTYHQDYVRGDDKVRITCPIHGDFYQPASSHLQGHGCPSCGLLESAGERWLQELIEKSNISSDVIVRDRSILGNKEIDLLLNDLKIGFEYNGLIWHSERFGKDKSYHLNKTEVCESKGYSLIQIFEDEHLMKGNIVESYVKRIIGCNDGLININPRMCETKEVTRKEISEFLEKNDINGECKATVHIASIINGDIVCGMSFLRDRKDKSKWTVVRSCLRIDVNNDELFNHVYDYFVKTYNPSEVVAFEDRRWIRGKDYSKYLNLGFLFESYTKPEYSYYSNKRPKFCRIKQSDFKTSVLTKKYGVEVDDSIEKLETRLGFTKIWDCGKIKYKWNNNIKNI